MSLTSILSRERVERFERWELPVVGAPDPEPTAEAAEDAGPQRPTVAEIEAIERQAREEGFNAGLNEGRAMAKRELAAQVARVDAIIAAMQRPFADLDHEVAGELAALATVIAERVLGFEIATRPQTILDVVRQAVDALPAATRHLKIHLNPADAAIVREHRSAVDPDGTVVDDASLERGDVRLESEHSRLDARVRTRLAAVIDSVLVAPIAPAGEDDTP
ncbi:flagellar assembly protein FliH [Luteibacter sp. PPL201]|jgi:flagellar assembly protein FliH|uniref:Flagellar assembly protein FliH n=1 Tax=Luteibacter sahnii TaxID=3021977 RepID=A0ABT6BD54_9GAMM|nr:flagellar assembly protein FliH [Luteibacter sp. PPL193]MDY1547128.1 flagellar assembly protein FliH [Luteibacter sp. PPL193]